MLVLVAPAAAMADSVTVAASADPVEDVAYQITASGTGSDSYEVFATLKPTGGTSCAANYAGDDGASVISGDASGSFNHVVNHTTNTSGTYLLCAWVQYYSGSTTASASAQAVITVRPPRASGALIAPATVRAGSVFQLTMRVQTEVDRRVLVTIDPPSVGCGANYSANNAALYPFDVENVGGPFPYTTNVTAPAAPGLYRICGYVQESSLDTVPEGTFGGQFTVVTAACTGAMQRVAKYSAVLKRHTHAAKSYAKRAAHASSASARRKLKRRAASERRVAKRAAKSLRAARRAVGRSC